jgi:hypothetical protein
MWKQLGSEMVTYGNSWWATILRERTRIGLFHPMEGRKKEKEDAELKEPRRFEGSMGGIKGELGGGRGLAIWLQWPKM